MKVLLVMDAADGRALLRRHLETGIAGVDIREHVPLRDGPLAADFHASGFDLVLLDGRPHGAEALDWLQEWRARPRFPPIIYLVPTRADVAEEGQAALLAGAAGCVVQEKIAHRAFVALVDEAAREHRRARNLFRSSPEGVAAARFGETVIKGLRCVRPVAQSALSTVYLAESDRLGSLVALKLLRHMPDMAKNPGSFDRFLQEYEIIRTITHPNVVRIHELGVADDHAFLMMEYLGAGDLRSRIRRGIDPAGAPAMLRQMAGALGAIHDVGVLHRDLKPGNVMLRADGTVALIDFGLAKQLALESEITANGEIFGTPYYMSPEQGHGRTVDERSDLYSLGIIFFELLTGRKPYLAATPMAVIYQHVHAKIPALPVEHALWSPIWERLVAKRPEDRFQSARELIKAIDRLPGGF
jgi:CheY-like chemotaxis protein